MVLMPTLVVVRHGLSTSNVEGTLAGRTLGVQLTEAGRSQAMGVGERLRGISFTHVVVSRLRRCAETWELLSETAGIWTNPRIDDRALEADYGDWTGRPLSELVTEPLWQTILTRPSEVRFPGGESMLETRERVLDLVHDLNADSGTEDTWLLVTHGDPIKMILSDALGAPFDEFQRVVVDPASISVVHYVEGGKPLVIAMNTLEGQIRRRLPPGMQHPQLGGGVGAFEDDDE